MISPVRVSGLIAVCVWILSILIDSSDAGKHQVESTKSGADAAWGPWGEWGECKAKACGTRGKKYRRRKCIKPSPDQDCPHGQEEEHTACPNLCGHLPESFLNEAT